MENRDISYRNHLDRNNGIKEEWKIRNDDDSEDRRCTRFLTTASGATIFSDPWNRAGIGQFYRTILFATIDFAFPRTSWSLLPRKKRGGKKEKKGRGSINRDDPRGGQLRPRRKEGCRTISP